MEVMPFNSYSARVGRCVALNPAMAKIIMPALPPFFLPVHLLRDMCECCGDESRPTANSNISHTC